jgi:hypothetical protein
MIGMRILLVMVYYLLVTPVGWVVRLAGFDPLSSRGKPKWTKREY